MLIFGVMVDISKVESQKWKRTANGIVNGHAELSGHRSGSNVVISLGQQVQRAKTMDT